MLKQMIRTSLVFAASISAALPALAQTSDGTVSAPYPRAISSPIRIAPVGGASSFTTNSKVSTDNFDQGFSAGILADFGPSTWAFETGIITLQSTGSTSGDSGAINVDTWGIPLLAKLNFSGKPHETVFVKLGAMPFNATGDESEFDVLGVAGIGAAIPLGRSSAIILDATYNRLFTDSGDITDYQGIALLAGLSFNL